MHSPRAGRKAATALHHRPEIVSTLGPAVGSCLLSPTRRHSREAQQVSTTCAGSRQEAPRLVHSVQQAATPASPAVSHETVSLVVVAMTVYHLAIFALMLVSSSARPIQKLIRSLWPFVPLALGYGLLLANSWTPDTLSIMMPGSLEEGLKGFKPQFFPVLESISTLFQRPPTAASWLLHVWSINLFLGRTILLEGIDTGISTWHSLLLACVFGPLGMLSHMITKMVWKPSTKPLIFENGTNGTITVLPYDS